MEPQSPQPPRPASTTGSSPPPPLPELPAPYKFSAANQACWYVGAFLIAAGVVGLVVPGLFYAHLNPIHDYIFILTGVGSVLLGIGKPDYTAKKICYWLGGFYTLMGVAGFLLGVRAVSLTRPTVSGAPAETAFLWKPLPGRFELGTVDHSVHLLVGVIYLASAYFTLRKHHAGPSEPTWH